MAADAGGPYQSLINLYLRDCVAQASAGANSLADRTLTFSTSGTLHRAVSRTALPADQHPILEMQHAVGAAGELQVVRDHHQTGAL